MALTKKQQLFADAFVRDPQRVIWRAAWAAGYNGCDPKGPEPSEAKKVALQVSGNRALKSAQVQEYLGRIESEAMSSMMATEDGKAIVSAVMERTANVWDAGDLAARNLDMIVHLALGDPRDVVQWDNDEVTVTPSDELEWWQAAMVRGVKHSETENLRDGTVTRTTTVDLVDRTRYVAMLEKRTGASAPQRVELSGPGGMPLGRPEARGLRAETVEHVRRLIIGPDPSEHAAA